MRSALADAGFVVAAAEYRTVPDMFPGPVEDGKAAICYLRAHAKEYDIDPTRIGVIGDSAGGWMSQMMGTTNGEGFPDEIEKIHHSKAITEALLVHGAAFRTFCGANI